MPKYINFEEFLMEKHAAQYTGLDDEMVDDFAHWIDGLDQWELIQWADEYCEKKIWGLTG